MITGGSRWVIILHSLTEYSIHTLLTVYSMHTHSLTVYSTHTLHSAIILHSLNQCTVSRTHCTAMLLFHRTFKHM